ncbi:MAG: NAD-dependent epimerase/dehydratase family protein, partial [Verrucomicrobiaceae bacterium]
VIPKWIHALLSSEPVIINGNGENTRDFCFVKDVVRANIKAASATLPPRSALALNVGGGRRISLTELFDLLAALSGQNTESGKASPRPNFGPARPGDILHSMADVSAAEAEIGFRAQCDLETSLRETLEWFASNRPRQ